MRRLLPTLLGAALAGLLTAAPAAADDDCLPAGGVDIPAADTAEGDFSFTGRGWGHGAGMSQYGAQGAALLGCDAETILATYFPGITVEDTAATKTVRVSLYPYRPGGPRIQVLNVEALAGGVRWTLDGDDGDEDGGPPPQPEDSRWTLIVAEDGSYRLFDGADERWGGGGPGALLRAEFDGGLIRLPAKGYRYARGTLEFLTTVGDDRAGMFVTLELDSLEEYLYGLAEMPSSWPHEALRAQAIAGRSYALSRMEAYAGERADCRCDLFDTVWDQVYSGYEKESEGADGRFGQRWTRAVDATAGLTLRYDGRTAVGFYSSSHGGHSESTEFVFGGSPVSYLQPVDDSRWDAASDNPYRTWAVGIDAERLGDAFGVGTAEEVRVLEPRGAAGRVGDPARGWGGLEVRGSDGTAEVSGDLARSRLGLRSTLFDAGPGIRPPREPDVPPSDEEEPVAAVVPVERIAGPERVSTAVAASAAHWGGADDVLLATAADFPDALAAGALAGRLGAPLLLTEPAALPAAVGAELDRLGAERVWILGGELAVGVGVEEALRALGYDTRRLAGADRFATAAAVSARAGAAATREVTLVAGGGWPDAVASGALAAAPQRTPTLLTGRVELPAATRQALADLGTERVTLVGGETVISAEVEAELGELGYEVRRLAGGSRFATSAAVAGETLRRLDGAVPVVFASGHDFPDALAAGAVAARLGGVLLLAPRDDLEHAPATAAFVSEHAGGLDGAVLLGGPAAVHERVAEQLAELLAAAGDP